MLFPHRHRPRSGPRRLRRHSPSHRRHRSLASVTDVSATPERFRNADHCAFFWGSSVNAAVKATGSSSGTSVPRRLKVYRHPRTAVRDHQAQAAEVPVPMWPMRRDGTGPGEVLRRSALLAELRGHCRRRQVHRPHAARTPSARDALDVDSRTLWDQINALGRVLEPVHERLHAHVLSQQVIGADGTTGD